MLLRIRRKRKGDQNEASETTVHADPSVGRNFRTSLCRANRTISAKALSAQALHKHHAARV
jgi:hypothetical protein